MFIFFFFFLLFGDAGRFYQLFNAVLDFFNKQIEGEDALGVRFFFQYPSRIRVFWVTSTKKPMFSVQSVWPVSRIAQNYWPYCVALISSTIIINYIINTFPDYLSIVTSISSMKFLSKPSGLLKNMSAKILYLFIYFILTKPVIKRLWAWESTLHAKFLKILLLLFFFFTFSVLFFVTNWRKISLKFSTLSRQEVELQYLKMNVFIP